MDSYSFYKSLYDRELNRRLSLDNAISMPITALTLVVALNSYIFKEQIIAKQVIIATLCEVKLKHFILFLTIATILITIFYLIRSSNNLFKGFAYRNFAYVSDILKFENEIRQYNNLAIDESNKIEFADTIIKKLAELTDDHIIFNDKRSKDIHWAKTSLVISLSLTAINYIILTLNYIKI